MFSLRMLTLYFYSKYLRIFKFILKSCEIPHLKFPINIMVNRWLGKKINNSLQTASYVKAVSCLMHNISK